MAKGRVRVMDCKCKFNISGTSGLLLPYKKGQRKARFTHGPTGQVCNCVVETTHTKTGKGMGRQATFHVKLARLHMPTKRTPYHLGER